MRKRPPVPRPILNALEATGLPWEIVRGSRHNQLRISGRLAGVLPRRGGDERGCAPSRTIAQIRRVAREVRQSS